MVPSICVSNFTQRDLIHWRIQKKGTGVRGSGGPGVRGSGGPGVRIPPSTFSFLLPPVPKYLSEIKIIPTLR